MTVHKKTNKNKNKITRYVIILIVLLALAGGTYKVVSDHHHSKKSSTAQSSQTSTTKPSTSSSNTTSSGSSSATPGAPAGSIKNYTLVTSNPDYEIQQLPNTNQYLITLYPIVNNPSEYSTYNDQLKQFKQEALQYLTGKGINVNNLEITYDPSAATNL